MVDLEGRVFRYGEDTWEHVVLVPYQDNVHLDLPLDVGEGTGVDGDRDDIAEGCVGLRYSRVSFAILEEGYLAENKF